MSTEQRKGEDVKALRDMAAKFRRLAAALSEPDHKLFLQRAEDLESEASELEREARSKRD